MTQSPAEPLALEHAPGVGVRAHGNGGRIDVFRDGGGAVPKDRDDLVRLVDDAVTLGAVVALLLRFRTANLRARRRWLCRRAVRTTGLTSRDQCDEADAGAARSCRSTGY